MAYSGCIQPSTMVENVHCIDISSADTSDEDGHECEHFEQGETHKTTVTLQEIYNVALALRNELESKKPVNWYGSWPPVSSDITIDSVKKIVSPILYNFVAWLVGFSDEPEQSDYVQIHEKDSQDIFHLSRFIKCFQSWETSDPKVLVISHGCPTDIRLLRINYPPKWSWSLCLITINHVI